MRFLNLREGFKASQKIAIKFLTDPKHLHTLVTLGINPILSIISISRLAYWEGVKKMIMEFTIKGLILSNTINTEIGPFLFLHF